MTYRISHREDARLLFEALDQLRRVMEKAQWIIWILYLHLISRKKALAVAMKYVFVESTASAVKKLSGEVKKSCTVGETLWDTRRPTGGVDRALEVVTGHSELLFAAEIAKLEWSQWRPHRLHSKLSHDIPLLRCPGYHRGKTLRFLSDAAGHISGQPVPWQRQDWELQLQLLPGTGEVASDFDLTTYTQACAGAAYIDAMLRCLSPSAQWPSMTLSDLSCGLCLEHLVGLPHKDDPRYVKKVQRTIKKNPARKR